MDSALTFANVFRQQPNAVTIESGCEFITTDRDFSRFPGLRWRHPLAERA